MWFAHIETAAVLRDIDIEYVVTLAGFEAAQRITLLPRISSNDLSVMGQGPLGMEVGKAIYISLGFKRLR